MTPPRDKGRHPYMNAVRDVLTVLASHDYGRFGLDFQKAVEHEARLNQVRAIAGVQMEEAEAFLAALARLAARSVYQSDLFEQVAVQALCQGETMQEVLDWLTQMHPGRNPQLALEARASMIRALGPRDGAAMFAATYGANPNPSLANRPRT